MNISVKAFKERWETFKRLANEGKIKKIPYDDYRTLDSLSKGLDPEWRIEFNRYTPVILFFCNNNITQLNFSGLTEDFFNIMEATLTERKEDKPMNMPTMKFDFGPITNGSIVMSPYGLAVRTKDNTFLAYNKDAHQTVDVTGFTFDIKNMIYKLPAPVQAIGAGDMILHQGRPMIVTEVFGNISAIDLLNSEAKTIVPVSNLFGFNYVTKITSMMNLGNVVPSAEHPFGNIFPMMMLSSMMNDEDSNNSTDFSKMMMMSMMMGGQNPFMTLFTPANPQ